MFDWGLNLTVQSYPESHHKTGEKAARIDTAKHRERHSRVRDTGNTRI